MFWCNNDLLEQKLTVSIDFSVHFYGMYCVILAEAKIYMITI